MDKNREVKIKGAVTEIANSLLRIDAERDLIKEIIDKIAKEEEINKKTLRKLGRTYYKQNYGEEQQSFDEFSDLYESVFETTSTNPLEEAANAP
tara:strand:+ start:413 stop:694 length:282 start_codon:yes stop_codon:yes gene_type:complete